MPQIVTAFWGEGSSDYRSLPILLERVIEKVVSEHGRGEYEICPPIQYAHNEIQGENIEEKYLALARKASGVHFIVVHHDAGSTSEDEVLTNSFTRGYEHVLNASGRRCQILIPMIPIREMEAWLLADSHTLDSILGQSQLSADDVPLGPREVEGLPDPKQLLLQLVESAFPTRRKRLLEQRLYGVSQAIALEMSLETLLLVPAFERFYRRVHQEMQNLGFAN